MDIILVVPLFKILVALGYPFEGMIWLLFWLVFKLEIWKKGLAEVSFPVLVLVLQLDRKCKLRQLI